ncbi:MAG TPA: glycerophosphodiester phosphodiesterase [Acidimicrobiia bacterium]|nr:glycerophosphodiester phosphodiesterase [Acidimicrobiia bacterium]
MNGDFLVVGHRGWPQRFPDNTLGGCLAAAGVSDAVEVDVRRCGDGRLVLSHDPTLCGYHVAETPWSVLADLDLGGGHHPALLDEVLAALPETAVQIEVKNWPGDPGFEPDHRLALEAAERARPGDIVTGFNPETLAAVRRVFSNVTTGLCIPGAFDLDDAVEVCVDAGHGVLIPEFALITEELNVPLLVFPWTVNDPARVIELVELGVTGIITDDPGLISTLRN